MFGFNKTKYNQKYGYNSWPHFETTIFSSLKIEQFCKPDWNWTLTSATTTYLKVIFVKCKNWFHKRTEWIDDLAFMLLSYELSKAYLYYAFHKKLFTFYSLVFVVFVIRNFWQIMLLFLRQIIYTQNLPKTAKFSYFLS